jgi:NAD(P)-dependent dehydrogenase (short-subunit alcohol dehydrogenase family)
MEIELMKMAIVTGAARGIGLATARLFVDQGYQVAMVDRDEDALDAAASLAGGTALFVMCLTLQLLTKWLQRCWRFQGGLIVLSIMLALLISARLKIPALRVGALLWQPILTVFIFVRGRFLPR